MALMNSFYGGRRGASFVIVKNYLDVLTMVSDFSQGNGFLDVKFDEYVMINNPRKNHPDNGKIFRRGYDYDSDRTLSSITVLYNGEERYDVNDLTEAKYTELGENDNFKIENIPAHGAEYIGSIIGPAGKAPLLSIGPYEWANSKNAEAGLDTRKGSGQYSPTGVNPGLIPGKEGNTYHDSIEWTYTSIRNDDYGDDTEAFIGFKFPYLVTQMQTKKVEPYVNGDYQDTSSITRIDDRTHPYYNKWELDIPKGIKGDSFRNLKIVQLKTVTTYLNNYKTLNQLSSLNNPGQQGPFLVDASTGQLYRVTENLTNQDGEKKVFIYEDWNYDTKENGIVTCYYLGDYNQIENVTLSNSTGMITVSFSNKPSVQLGPLKWITDINLFAGRWDNNGNWVSTIENGDIPNQHEKEDLNVDNGSMVIHFNNSEKVFQLPWVEEIFYREEEGKLYYKRAGSDEEYPITDYRSINNIEQDEKSLSITYTDLDPLTGEPRKQTFAFKSIMKIDLLKDGDDNVFKIFERDQNGNILRDDNGNPIYKTSGGIVQTETLTGIVVYFTDGDYKLITGQRVYYDENTQTTIKEEVGGGFDFLEEFNFDTENSQIEYKTLNGEKQTIPIVFPTAINYNTNTGQIDYTNSKGATTPIGNLPIVQSVDIGRNLDVYVRMSREADAYFSNIDPTHDSHDTAHQYSTGNYWYKIGNLIQNGMTFVGTRRTFTLEQLYGIAMTLPSSQEDIIQRWTDWRTGEDTDIDITDIENLLNAKFPEGMASVDSNPNETIDEIALSFIAVGDSNSSKAFYAYNYDQARSVQDRMLGSWFYVGTIGDLSSLDSIIKISETGNANSDSAIILKSPVDIYQIQMEDIYASNPMKEIKANCTYRTFIKNILLDNQEVQIKMNGTLIGSFSKNSNFPITTYDWGIIDKNDLSPYELIINNVKGPIVITKVDR